MDVAPRLNIFGDDELARLCEQVKDRISRASIRTRSVRRKTFDPASSAPGSSATPTRSRRSSPATSGRRSEHGRQGGGLMAARVLQESAQRVSDCVTALLRRAALLRKSRACGCPLRADAEPRDPGQRRAGHPVFARGGSRTPNAAPHQDRDRRAWCMACALKHHTRRGDRDPERWQLASQLVTHGLLRDAGFVLPPDAEAWDGVSVEQAYDRLPEAEGRRNRPATAQSRSGRRRDGHRRGNGQPSGARDGDDDSSDDGTDTFRQPRRRR